MFTKYGYVELPKATFYPNGGVNTYYQNIYAYPVNAEGKVGCPVNVYYDDICPPNNCPPQTYYTPTTYNQPYSTPSNNYSYTYERPLAIPKPNVVYIETEYDNATGHPVTSVGVPSANPFNIYQGTGIGFELLSEGIKISNNGVVTLKISGESGSGLTATNIGTENNPNYKLSFNPSELVQKAGAVQKIVFNGATYEAIQGVITISGGSPAISNIQSPNNTLTIASLSIGILGISVKPIKVNSNDVAVGGTGTLVNLVDGLNTTVANSSGNNVQVNVSNNAFAKTVLGNIPNSKGDVELITSRQGAKELDANEVSNIKSSTGLDLLSLNNISGTNPSQVTNSDTVLLYIEDKFVPITKYVRTNSTISSLDSSISLSTGDTLTWVVIKSA